MKIALLLPLASFLVSTTAFVPSAPKPFVAKHSFLCSATALNGDTMATIPAELTVAAVPKVAQRWRKSTKQVITLGPVSSTVEMIEKLFLAGADVFRLNFSHGSQEQKKQLLDMIRVVEEKYNHPIAVLGDLQGPKLRVSNLIVDDVAIVTGSLVT